MDSAPKYAQRSTLKRRGVFCRTAQPSLNGQWCRIVAEFNNRYSEDVRLRAGVSLSHARFTLSNFCLNSFGADGQYLADLIDFCVDANQLQEVLNTIRDEVRSRFPDRLPSLVVCVRETNETVAETAAPTATAALSPTLRPPPPAPKRGDQVASMGGGTPAPVPARAVAPRSVAQPQPSRGVATDPMRLEAGVSLVQARFALSEFCLDQFGARAQQLMDAIDHCADVAALQKVLILIGADVQERRRECLPKLIDCVREINETGD
jgi:hypothetical protein